MATQQALDKAELAVLHARLAEMRQLHGQLDAAQLESRVQVGRLDEMVKQRQAAAATHHTQL
jgi:hypothetical protein